MPKTVIRPGTAVSIATGGMVPRGADAVVMVEHAETRGRELRIARAVTAGSGVSFAGTDITAGETVLRRGQLLTSRDTGVLAAIGVAAVDVWRKPIVAILSTGDEIIAPGEPMQPAKVYDSNAQVLADAVRELGGEPKRLGITHDDMAALRERLQHALEFADVVLLSGGTSKGAGDLSYRVVAELRDPGIVAHGVALKPGKPICLAATRGRPVVVLPGFPTSAIFTFHEFVAPVLRLLAGRGAQERTVVPARLAVKVNSEIGRTEYLLVGLVETADEAAGHVARRVSDGTGIRQRHDVQPRRRFRDDRPARGDRPGGHPRRRSAARPGAAAGRPRGDREPLHRPRLPAWRVAAAGRALQVSRRRQHGGIGGRQARRMRCRGNPSAGSEDRPVQSAVSHPGAGPGRRLWPRCRASSSGGATDVSKAVTAREAIADARQDPACVMVNRNQGSGTRALIDRLLEGVKPAGYAVQPQKSQRRGRRRLARPRGLGSDAGHDCQQRRARIPAGAGGTLRFRGAEIARESPGRGGVQDVAAEPSRETRWRASG